MPKNVSLFRLFLASPSDVEAERKVVGEVVDEFNRNYGDRLGARLEVCSWERSTYPAQGTYAQGVINSQIGEDYDIFLGILWTRFGSKTLDYESGTEEEYYRALQLSERAGRVHIMMYFNNAGLPLNRLDVEQFAKVQNFQQKIAELGCYYFKYDGLEQFRQDLSSHLYKVVSHWEENHPEVSGPLPSLSEEAADAVPPLPEEHAVEVAEAGGMDELGILELREKIDGATLAVVSALEEMREATDWIGVEMNAGAGKLRALNASRPSNLMQLGKQHINVLAAKMNQYSMRMESPVHRWIVSFEELVEANRNLMLVAEESVSEDMLRERKKELRELDERMEYAYGETYKMYVAVKNLPKMTQPIILAKKNICSKLKKLLESMERGRTLVGELGDAINRRLYRSEE